MLGEVVKEFKKWGRPLVNRSILLGVPDSVRLLSKGLSLKKKKKSLGLYIWPGVDLFSSAKASVNTDKGCYYVVIVL